MKKLFSFLLFFTLVFSSYGLSVSSTQFQHSEIESHQLKTIKKLLDYFGIAYEDSFDGIIEATQKHWVRKPGQERWQMEKVIVQDEAYVLSLINDLNLIQEVTPKKKHYTHVLLLGSTLTTFQKRLEYLHSLFEQGIQFGTIYCLSGDRPLDPAIEKEDVLIAMKKNHEPTPKNESEMMQFVMEHSPFGKNLAKIPIVYVRCPMKKEGRPNTADTLLKWLELHPKKGSILVISNQPFIQYQHLVVQTCVDNGFDVETVGPKREAHQLEIYLDQIARQLIWAKLFQEKKEKKLAIKPVLSFVSF
jgi:hypothetical protein